MSRPRSRPRTATLSPADIEREFDATSTRYDRMVSLNPGYHEHLRSAAHALAARLATGAPRVVDLGCGSGASTKALTDAVPNAVEVIGVDASAGMIDAARAKSWPAGVRFVHAPAEQVDDVASSVDGVFAAYLFRNLADPDAGLRAVGEVLRPDGCLVVQEYSVAGSVRAAAVWTLVCWLIVIPLSLIVTGRTRLYRYLWRSVLRFDSIPRFERRLREAGFDVLDVSTAGGWQRGILHTIVARRVTA